MQSIAVVGISAKKDRPSNYVSMYMKSQGYRIIPVNPNEEIILNEKCYPDLLEIPNKVEIINVFRKSEYVVPIIRDAIKIRAKAVWLQDGIISEEASIIAKEAGLLFIMDDCMLRRHNQFY
ncbi:MAG: CoA-binding protein [Candidatus Marinimicrobia bacterium]|nr:CoA-binding protein [Candidatus Neomarinimicrobiota bacterium]|tara:strand:- start:313 stop:675 length:363 start_codon:yes stop_codon:yes gene_type:complete